MKHNSHKETKRSTGRPPVSSGQHSGQKDPRERNETTRENKAGQGSLREHEPAAGGKHTPAVIPNRTTPRERERRSGRASFGGYQGL